MVLGDQWQSYVPGATLGRPAMPDAIIERSDLVQPLLKACDGVLVVICAPAGYGKTTAAALWDATDIRPFAWVRIDHLDDDPAHLLLHIVTAVAQVYPVDGDLLRYLRAPSDADLSHLVPLVARMLESCGPVVVVLDDVHQLRAPVALETLSALVDAAPATTTFALVGRGVVSLDLARRRLAGGVIQLGVEQLRFVDSEAAAVFAAINVGSDEATLRAVLDSCEGWPAGIALAAMALRDGTDVSTISGGHQLIADYLLEEVLGRLDAPMVTFMTESSVLERFCATQLDELLLRDDSAKVLSLLRSSGTVLLIPLDAERIWFRYHTLLGDLLRARLRADDPARFRELERGASRLLEDEGKLDGALVHALAAQDRARAARLVGREAVRLGFDGRVEVLARRLALLDESTFAEYPDAAIARAWLGVSTGDADLIQHSLVLAARADRGRPLSDGTPSVRVAAALVGSLVGVGGVHEVVRCADVVREAGDYLVNPWWGAATVMKGAALSMMGELKQARVLLESALPVIGELPGFLAAALAHLALLDLGEGDDVGATRHSAAADQIVDGLDLCNVVPMVVVYATRAAMAARNGDDAAARGAVETTERLLDRLGALAARTALLGHGLLAWTGAALHDDAIRNRHLTFGDLAQKREPDALGLSRRLDRVRALSEGGERRLLTAAELRLLPHLATNLSLQQIATELVIGRETAKSQAASIYRKFMVSSRGAAVVEARRLGLLSD